LFWTYLFIIFSPPLTPLAPMDDVNVLELRRQLTAAQQQLADGTYTLNLPAGLAARLAAESMYHIG
jgi:hypothetical protein